VVKKIPVVARHRQPGPADNCYMEIIAKYLIAIASLALVPTPILADEMELYCEGRHNGGTGAPVIQTHLWLKITASEGTRAIEVQGPVFKKNSLVVEESPTELKATQFNYDRSIEQHIVLNRQTLRLNYSVRTGPEVDHLFSGICSRYSPKI
jgi:hypothetical protein